MEIFEVILHTTADDEGLRNIVNYPIKGDEVMVKGYGVTPYDTDSALMQFKKTAEYWGNEDKTPVYHYVLSFTKETAPTVERAMEITEEVFSGTKRNHLTLFCAHQKERGPSIIHTHTVQSPTNYNDGSMMYADNSTLFPLAQRAADITQHKCRLVVKPEDKEKKEFHRVFYPHKNTKD